MSNTFNKYRPGPVLVGAAKCAKKGHRPPNKSGWCTRCGTMVDPTKRDVVVPLPPDPAAVEALAAMEVNRQAIADAFRGPPR